jgi:hypothetical protein
MVKKELLEQIYSDFSIIIQKKEILGILLYGSYLRDKETSRSDIDVGIVAPNEDIDQLISFILQNVNVSSKKYDVRLFQELPLYIKIQVIEKGELIYSPNELDLYEYFYLYRKLWNDQKHRQEISREELISFLD